MSLSPFSRSEEADWHEKVRRRELYRCAFSLSHLSKSIQFTEDFPSTTPNDLANLIGVTAKFITKGLESDAPAKDLVPINTFLEIITAHLRYVERARVAQTPWSIIQSAERLLKLATDSGSYFILRPTWAYNYSIVGEFLGLYEEFVSSWSWFSVDEWKKELRFKDEKSIYCISFPRIERTNCLLHANWGHEVGHILVAKWVEDSFGIAWGNDEPAIKARIEKDVSKDPPPGGPLFKDLAIQSAVANQVRATMDVARQGFVELLCDLIGVHIFGPSALAATMEFAARFAMDISPLQSSNYPPWRYRLRKLLQHCAMDLDEQSGIGYPNPEISSLIEWLRTGYRLTESYTDMQVIESTIVTKEAYEFISRHWDKAAQQATAMLRGALAKPYRLREHHDRVAKLVVRLRHGVPPNEVGHLAKQPASFQDILTAAWAFKMDQTSHNPGWGTPDEYNQLFRLVLKACESSFVQDRWGEKIGAIDL
jgi:hypothetical protein